MSRCWRLTGLLTLAVLACALRVGVVLTTFDPHRTDYAYEHGEIAKNLLAGKGFSVWFLGHEGPTSQQAPLYPLLVAAMYRWFGAESAGAMLAIELLQCLAGTLLVVAVYSLTRRLVPDQPAAGWIAALGAAVYPTHIYMVTHVQVVVWASLLLVLLLATVTAPIRRDGLRAWWMAKSIAVAGPGAGWKSPDITTGASLRSGPGHPAGHLLSQFIRHELANRTNTNPQRKQGTVDESPQVTEQRIASRGVASCSGPGHPAGHLLSQFIRHELANRTNTNPQRKQGTVDESPQITEQRIASRGFASCSSSGHPADWLRAVLAGIAGGVLLLVEPILVLTLPIAWWMLLTRDAGSTLNQAFPRTSIRSRVATAFIMPMVTLVVIAPWLARNYYVHGQPVFIKSTFGYAFWQGNNSQSWGTDKIPKASAQQFVTRHDGSVIGMHQAMWEGRHETLYIDDVLLKPHGYARFEGMREPDRAQALGLEAWQFICANPAHYLRLCGQRLKYFLLFDETNPKTANLVYRASTFIWLVLAIAGAFVVRRQRRLWPLMAIFAAVTAFHALTITSVRFRLPIEPLSFVWIGAAVTTVTRKVWGDRAGYPKQPADPAGHNAQALEAWVGEVGQNLSHQDESSRPATQSAVAEEHAN